MHEVRIHPYGHPGMGKTAPTWDKLQQAIKEREMTEKEERDQLWRELGVDNQTAALVRLRGLVERDSRPRYPRPMPQPRPKRDTWWVAAITVVMVLAVIVWQLL